jgi:hypothetical protein
MAKGMGCYFHPEEKSVAQCIKCGKGICKSCIDNYGKTGKYAGLCRDCILETGIECKDHPSKQAEAYCEICREPICGDCYDRFKFCYNCTTKSLNNEIADYKEKGKIEKIKIILVIIFSVIGLAIGLAIATGEKWSDISLIGIWLCLGIGGNFRVALSEFPEMVRASFSVGLKSQDSYLLGLLWGLCAALLFPIFWLLLKSLAGPIIPIIKIIEYAKNIKIAKSTVADDTEILIELADYYEHSQYIEKNDTDVKLANSNASANTVLDENAVEKNIKIKADELCPKCHGLPLNNGSTFGEMLNVFHNDDRFKNMDDNKFNAAIFSTLFKYKDVWHCTMCWQKILDRLPPEYKPPQMK